ncbi:fimbrial biogenesis chaperone [Klebsiella spallanzanii]|uniref:fimbrial biogenesis chaperone n=2 Tax=Klebsiella spallanzanii TaxID=2587528 RepID=UPI00259348C5|nr:molecular chaperone [Klebsiella spallanzanii]MDM4205598.1 molecular chaperone [Klebsiella spallanzanii]
MEEIPSVNRKDPIMKKNIIAVLLAMTTVFPACASVVITGTRVIYPATEREVTVKMENKGSSPVLIQSWVDNGDPTSTPDTAKAPFLLTPPINRVNAGKGQTLRIRFTGETLPQDKESVFYLNVLEIPPTVKGELAEKNLLSMAFRSRLKLFYRPQNLIRNASEAPENVVWKRQGNKVTANNATPYHVTVAYFSEDEKGEKNLGAGSMLIPGETHTWTLDRVSTRWYPMIINDYGALRPVDPNKK